MPHVPVICTEPANIQGTVADMQLSLVLHRTLQVLSPLSLLSIPSSRMCFHGFFSLNSHQPFDHLLVAGNVSGIQQLVDGRVLLKQMGTSLFTSLSL